MEQSSDFLQTLIKAFRFCTAQDMYNPAQCVLKTITRDTVTFRARDIKPGEQVDSIWDTIQKGRTSSWGMDDKTKEPKEFHEPDLSRFYNEADVQEDAILFPEQASSGTVGDLFRGHETSMQDFMSKGPDWERFIEDLDTDEEYGTNEEYSTDEDYETSDSDAKYVLEHDASQHEDMDREVNKYLAETTRRSHDSEDSSSDGSDDENGSLNRQLMRMLSLTTEEKQDYALLKSWKSPTAYRENVEKEFYTFFDREKSKGE